MALFLKGFLVPWIILGGEPPKNSIPSRRDSSAFDALLDGSENQGAEFSHSDTKPEREVTGIAQGVGDSNARCVASSGGTCSHQEKIT